MSLKCPEYVKEKTVTTGTGDITLSGALPGMLAFSSQLVDGDLVPYYIVDLNATVAATMIEEGLGVWHSGTNTLTRTQVISSTSSNALVNLAAGTKAVGIGLPGSWAAASLFVPAVLDLDFTHAGGNLEPRLTFSRSSAANYYNASGILASATTNAPRFDYDPSNLVFNGVLVENAGTNLLLQSNGFGTTWASSGPINGPTSQASAAVTGPDGTASGWSLTDNGTSFATYGKVQGLSVSASTYYTFSCYFKKKDYQYASLRVEANISFWYQAFFDLNAGTVAGVQQNAGNTTVIGTIQALPNGWFRCAIVVKLGATDTTANFEIIYGDGAGVLHTGVVGTGIYVFGAQVESGGGSSYGASSYIATTTTTANRSADSLTINTSAFPFNAYAGTMLHEYRVVTNGVLVVSPYQFRNASNTQRLGSEFKGANGGSFMVSGDFFNISGALSQSATAGNVGTVGITGSVKVGSSYSQSVLMGAIAGGTPAAGSPFLTVANDITYLTLLGPFWHKRFTYWNQQLPSSLLQLYTATGAP
jgi:hypothetical protein